MITPADDYPIHQSPEPIASALSTENSYDRYFFNGYSADGSTFFALAMGFYPGLGVVDAAFCVQRDGVQHNVRASKSSLPFDVMTLRVGPISIEVDEPLRRLRLHIDHDAVQASLEFDARCRAIQEPRFTREIDGVVAFDYTRMTQNGVWNGSIAVNGRSQPIESLFGTRDRSWGIRPLAANAVPNPKPGGQFFWLWTPINFDDCCAFYHLNADGDGTPWNQSGRIVQLLDGCDTASDTDLESNSAHSQLTIDEQRRVVTLRLHALPIGDQAATECSIELEPIRHFYMSGLGYTHPEWGHGVNHGDFRVGYDQINLDTVDGAEPLFRHVQALCSATMMDARSKQILKRGHGVIEQLFIGRYAPLGLE